MPTWTQVYFPFGEPHWWLSALVAALPIIVLFTLMAGFRVKPHWSALAGAITAVLVAHFAFTMPFNLAGGSFLYGVATGIMNIIWIVVAAVYLYDISVSTGDHEIFGGRNHLRPPPAAPACSLLFWSVHRRLCRIRFSGGHCRRFHDRLGV